MYNTLQQNTSEWLEWRNSKIGASDAPIIMGKSPWKSPLRLWEEKVGLKENNFKSAAMQRGIDLEDQARQAVSKMFGTDFQPEVIVHSEYEYIVASLDGISTDRHLVIEIKCPGKATHAKAVRGTIPDHYIIQMQHQMAVTGLEKIIYYSYDGNHGISLLCHRDQALIDEMLEKEHIFYECMVSRVPPKDEHAEAWEAWEA